MEVAKAGVYVLLLVVLIWRCGDGDRNGNNVVVMVVMVLAGMCKLCCSGSGRLDLFFSSLFIYYFFYDDYSVCVILKGGDILCSTVKEII